MKRLVRSFIDPLPRSLSTKSLALLVVMLLSGIGISVNEYLDSRLVPDRGVQSTPSILERCTRGEHRLPGPSKPTADTISADPAGSTGAWITAPRARPATAAPSIAPTEWVPESDAETGSSNVRTNAVSER